MVNGAARDWDLDLASRTRFSVRSNSEAVTLPGWHQALAGTLIPSRPGKPCTLRCALLGLATFNMHLLILKL